FSVVTGGLDHFAFATSASPQTAGTAFSITVTAQDPGNNTVTSFDANGNKVMLTSTGALTGAPITTAAFTSSVITQNVTITNSGGGSVTGLGSSTAVAGVATLTVTGNAVGSVTITASATGSSGALATGTGNPITFNVVAGNATKLALSGATTDLTSSATRLLTATIQDTAGNTITTGADSTLSVTFGKTSGTGSVTGLGSSTAVAGVATLTVTGNV